MAHGNGSDVIIVGSGPNGLAAAVTLARAGLAVQVLEAEPDAGGGTRRVRLAPDRPVWHDLCSAVHPLAAASPFFREFDLAQRGVRMVAPAVSYAQLIDHDRAAVAYRDLDRTVGSLGADGPRWRQLFEPLIAAGPAMLDSVLFGRPVDPGVLRAVPGLMIMLSQATRLWNVPWRTPDAPALLTGVAAHPGTPMPGSVSTGTMLMLGLIAHTDGWPIPVGGSRVITQALEDDLRDHGGSVLTSRRVREAVDLPPARAYLFDTHPADLARIIGDRVGRVLHRRRTATGSGVAKIDFELTGPVPWADPRLREAATIHLGGDRRQLTSRERSARNGRGHGVVLVSDPVVADPSRQHQGLRPLWTYTHVAYGSGEDVADAVQAELEAAAPGFSDLVAYRRSIPAARLADHNANYHGGDIAVGVRGLPDALLGTPRRLPYTTSREDVFCCSAATPPGPGVHGMSGYRAALTVLRRRFGIRSCPSLAPD